MNLLLLAVLGVAPGARATVGHPPVTTDIVRATVGNILPVSVTGLDDWAVSVDGTVFCQSEDGFLALLRIKNPAWSSGRTRQRDKAEAAQFELQVLSLSTRVPLPADNSGTCLVTDRTGHLRELRFEVTVVDRSPPMETVEAVRLSAPDNSN